MKIVGIYKITSPTGCIYIGQSINITRRWAEYSKLKGCGKNTRLINSLKKYGFENHKFEILHQCKIEELNDLEIFYIKYYDSFNTEHGLNLHSGGSNHIISDETKLKQSESHIGQKAWNKGIKRTDEEKKAHSLKMKGRKLSEETKQRMSTVKIGRKLSEETRKKISEKLKGNKNGINNTANLGRKLSEEVRIKMSNNHKSKK